MSFKSISFLLFLGLVSCVSPSAVAPLKAEAASSEPVQIKGKHAFLPYIFIDLDRGLEIENIFKSVSRIKSCNSDAYNCLNGKIFRLAWPKNCISILVGDTWANGSISTSVISTYQKTIRHGRRERFISRTEGVRDSLYLLDKRFGLVGVIHDPARRGTLASLADNGQFLEELNSGGSRKIKGGYLISDLVGWDRLGECNKP